MANPEVSDPPCRGIEIDRDEWRDRYRQLSAKVIEAERMIGGHPMILGNDAVYLMDRITHAIRKLLRQRELDPLEIHYLLEMLEKLGWNRDENGGSVAVWLRGFLAGKGVVMPIGDDGGKGEI